MEIVYNYFNLIFFGGVYLFGVMLMFFDILLIFYDVRFEMFFIVLVIFQGNVHSVDGIYMTCVRWHLFVSVSSQVRVMTWSSSTMMTHHLTPWWN